MEANKHLQEPRHSSELEEGCEIRSASPRCHAPTREDSVKPPIPPKLLGLCLDRKRNQPSSATIQEPSSLCSRCDPLSSLPLWSCAKITRSKGKRGRPLGESTKALKKRLDSIRIDPETIHGHPTPQYVTVSRRSSSLEISDFYRSSEKLPFIPSIEKTRKAKTSKTGKLENSRKIYQSSARDANYRKAENLPKRARRICLVTVDLASFGYDSLLTLS